MALISNDIDRLYYTTERIALYFDRFINFHYTHVLEAKSSTPENPIIFKENVSGQAMNIREVDLNKYFVDISMLTGLPSNVPCEFKYFNCVFK